MTISYKEIRTERQWEERVMAIVPPHKTLEEMKERINNTEYEMIDFYLIQQAHITGAATGHFHLIFPLPPALFGLVFVIAGIDVEADGCRRTNAGFRLANTNIYGFGCLVEKTDGADVIPFTGRRQVGGCSAQRAAAAEGAEEDQRQDFEGDHPGVHVRRVVGEGECVKESTNGEEFALRQASSRQA